MTTIEMLATKPSTQRVSVDRFDFEAQQLVTFGAPVAWQTGNSVQTFDGNGRPIDARADDND